MPACRLLVANAITAYIAIMSATPDPARLGVLNIRGLDPALKERLRIRAAQHGHSMEAEARAILHTALTTAKPASGAELVAAIRRRFAALGGVELDLPPREAGREPPDFR